MRPVASACALHTRSPPTPTPTHPLHDALPICRDDDADRYFKQAIALDPGLTIAYSALGQLAVRQKRFPDAKKYLTEDRKSTRLNSSHGYISYAVVGWKKKTIHKGWRPRARLRP